jgi:hypothetical protein
MKIDIPKECIDCIFNYDGIGCNLGEFIEEYGDTADEGKPEHCKISHIEVFNGRETERGKR